MESGNQCRRKHVFDRCDRSIVPTPPANPAKHAICIYFSNVCIQSVIPRVYQARTDLSDRLIPTRITTMKRIPIKAPLIASLLTLALSTSFVYSTAQAADMTHPSVMVGGQAMMPNKDIVDNEVNSADHTTLVAAVKAAGLVDTLKGKGPFTVFAPTNAAFGKLPAGTVDTLVKPDNKATLTHILTYHVVAGKLDASDLTDGKKLKTVEGEELTVKKADGKVMIIDAKGDSSTVTISNVHQSNGVIHVVDTVLMPAS